MKLEANTKSGQDALLLTLHFVSPLLLQVTLLVIYNTGWLYSSRRLWLGKLAVVCTTNRFNTGQLSAEHVPNQELFLRKFFFKRFYERAWLFCYSKFARSFTVTNCMAFSSTQFDFSHITTRDMLSQLLIPIDSISSFLFHLSIVTAMKQRFRSRFLLLVHSMQLTWSLIY